MGQETYNNDRLDDLSRRVFYTSIMAAEKELASGADPAKLRAFAAVADACVGGFKDEDDDTF